MHFRHFHFGPFRLILNTITCLIILLGSLSGIRYKRLQALKNGIMNDNSLYFSPGIRESVCHVPSLHQLLALHRRLRWIRLQFAKEVLLEAVYSGKFFKRRTKIPRNVLLKK